MTEHENETALERYAGRADVRELADRLLVMLPSVKAVGRAGALALAQVALAMDLNPLVGELWAIPSGDSFTIMAGIRGLRRAARNQAERDNGFYTVYHRIPRGDEIDGMTLNSGDIVRACDVTVVGDRARRYLEATGEPPRFTGIGIYRAGEKTRMQPLHCARKRAEADALKQAFDLPLVYADANQADANQADLSVVDAEIRECTEDA